MEKSRTNSQTATLDRGTDARGVSEVSFVEALAHPHFVFRHPEEIGHHPWFRTENAWLLLSWVRDELVAEQFTSH